MSDKGGILTAIGYVSLITIAGQVFNLLSEIIIAAYFGTSWMTDAYKMAMVVPILFTLELTTILGAVVIPVFYEFRATQGAQETFRVLLGATCLFAFILTAGAFLLAPTIVEIIASGFNEPTKRMTVELFRAACVVIFLSITVLFLSNILNGYKKFAFPAFQRVFLYCSVIAGVWLFRDELGISSALLGYCSGLLLFTVFLLRQTAKRELSLVPRFKLTHPAVKSAAILASPLILFSILNQVGMIVEKRIVSGFDVGTLSSLDFAFKVSVVFVNFLVFGASTVLFPTISESVLLQDVKRLQSVLTTVLKGIPAVVLPAITLLILLRVPIIRTLFERGAFSAVSTEKTSHALFWYTLGLLGNSMVNIIPRFFQALKQNTTLLKIGAFIVPVTIGFLVFLSQTMGFYGVPFALSIGTTLHMIVLLLVLQRHVYVQYREVVLSFAKVVVGSLCFGLVIIGAGEALGTAPTSFLFSVSRLVLAGAIATIVYASVCYLMKVEVIVDQVKKLRGHMSHATRL
jgi:putative peptidoglycan lipid II flippase